MQNIPRKLFSLFGEFMHEFNLIDFQCKSIIVDLMDDHRIGHILVMHQSFEFVSKRLDVIYREIIENQKLTDRWNIIYPKIKKFQEIRNDIAHSYCDVNPENKNEFVLTRFSEKQTLKLSQKTEFYEFDELKKNIGQLKKINIQLRHLFHSTFVKEKDVIFIRKPHE